MTSKIARASSVSEDEDRLPKEIPTVTITAHVFTGSTVDVSVPLTASVDEFKRVLAAKLNISSDNIDSFQVVHRGMVVERGTLPSHGIQAGSRVDISPRLRTGRLAPSPADQMAALKSLLGNIAASALPDGVSEPVSITIPMGSQTITVRIEPADGRSAPASAQPESPASPDLPSCFQSLFASDNGKAAPMVPAQNSSSSSSSSSSNDNGDEAESELPAEELERRRLLMQAAIDQAREQAAAERRRTADNKRTASKLEELQAKMRAKRQQRERACYTTKTALASGDPAPAPAPALPKAKAKPTFAGLRRGFLPLPPAPTPATAADSAAAAPVPTKASTFGGLKKGFLFKN
jgi:hypothetical protein